MAVQGKHYCKSCNQWIQNDPLSIKTHEKSAKHIGILERNVNRARKEKRNQEMADKHLQKQLMQIEKDARAKHNKTASKRKQPTAALSDWKPEGWDQRHMQLNSTLHPTSTLHSNSSINANSTLVPNSTMMTATPEINHDTGVYEIRGFVYLEGQRHMGKLVEGSTCEAWMEDQDRWVPSTIVKSRKVVAENSIQIVCDVSYLDNDNSKVVNNVLAENIRIKLAENISLKDYLRNPNAEENNVRASLVNREDNGTGIGEWSTVSVREIIAEEKVERKQPIGQTTEKEKVLSTKEMEFVAEEYGDDAMGAYNPHTGVYKGVRIPTEEQPDTQEVRYLELLSKDKTAFKKRKTSGTKMKNSKKKKSTVLED